MVAVQTFCPRLTFLAPLLVLAIAIACDERAPAGSGSADAGAGRDSGTGIPLDAGYLARDAELDDGAAAPDSGPASDAGFSEADAARADSGVLSADSGSPSDAGFVGTDAAGFADASPPADAGTAIDAGLAVMDAGTTSDAGITSPDTGVDSDGGSGVGTACDVLSQNCPSGLGCYLVSLTPLPEVWQCFTAGSVPFGGSCATQSECGPGAVCLNGVGYGCLEVCRYPNGGCRSGLPCQPLSSNGNHGYCRSEP